MCISFIYCCDGNIVAEIVLDQVVNIHGMEFVELVVAVWYMDINVDAEFVHDSKDLGGRHILLNKCIPPSKLTRI
jgi:hypothetical protein